MSLVLSTDGFHSQRSRASACAVELGEGVMVLVLALPLFTCVAMGTDLAAVGPSVLSKMKKP